MNKGNVPKTSPLRLIKHCAQWQPKIEWKKLQRGLRGIYVLHKHNPKTDCYDVVYVGMAAAQKGIKRRLYKHNRNKIKKDKWTHFSLFVVWENIRDDEIGELEALFREIYRKDVQANALNKQRGSKRIRSVRISRLERWPKSYSQIA
jgi:hypothetical protein